MLTHSVWWVWVPDICQSCNEQRPSHLLPSSPLFLVLLGRWQLVFHGTTKVGWKMTRQSGWGTPWQIAKDLKWKGTNIFGYDPSGARLCEYKGCFLHGPRPCAPEEQLYQVFFKGGCGNMEWPWTPKPTPEAVGIILHLCIDNKLGTIYVFTTCLYGSTIVYDIGCMMMYIYIYMYILYTPKKLSFHLSVPSIWSIWSTKDSLVWPPWHTLDTSGRQAHVARSLRFILYIKGKIDENWTKRIANTTLVRDKFPTSNPQGKSFIPSSLVVYTTPRSIRGSLSENCG